MWQLSKNQLYLEVKTNEAKGEEHTTESAN